MKAKERAKVKLLEYLGNPENEFLSRINLSTDILGYKTGQYIHRLFTAEEIDEIEREALEIRRKKYASQLARVDSALLRQAKAGDTPAVKLAYQRFEGWVEKKRFEGDMNLTVIIKDRSD